MNTPKATAARALRLTDPLMSGDDVKQAQTLLAKNPYGDFSPGVVDGVYGPASADATRRAKFALGYPGKQVDGAFGPVLLAYLQGTPLPPDYEDLRTQRASQPLPEKPAAAVPDLGPVVPGGKSILDQDLTHPTGGLDGFPAFDDGFQAGVSVIAPEPLTITAIGSAARRDGRPNGRSVHATGASKIRYWFGHVENPLPVGSQVGKGQKFATVSANHESPHLHVGVDAKPLIGRELEHHPDYTHGAPTVGVQLRRP